MEGTLILLSRRTSGLASQWAHDTRNLCTSYPGSDSLVGPLTPCPLYHMASCLVHAGLVHDCATHHAKWEKLVHSPTPYNEDLPGQWQRKVRA